MLMKDLSNIVRVLSNRAVTVSIQGNLDAERTLLQVSASADHRNAKFDDYYKLQIGQQ